MDLPEVYTRAGYLTIKHSEGLTIHDPNSKDAYLTALDDSSWLELEDMI